MIKFFRRIRPRLLAENRLGKYLLYALGEIVLVVIGILIALQINTWNEHRKTEAKAERLHRELYKELNVAHGHLKGNSEQLNLYIQFLDQLITDWDRLENKTVRENLPDMWGSQNLSLMFFITAYSQFHDPKHDMYNKAVSEGSISLIDKSFVGHLSDIYKAGNSRINQFIEVEYAFSQEMNGYISRTYASEILNVGRNSDMDCDQAAYDSLFQRFREDGALRYKLHSRLEQMIVRQMRISTSVIWRMWME